MPKETDLKTVKIWQEELTLDSNAIKITPTVQNSLELC